MYVYNPDNVHPVENAYFKWAFNAALRYIHCKKSEDYIPQK